MNGDEHEPVWTDSQDTPHPRDVPTVSPGEEKQHEHRLQQWVLAGLGGAFVVTLLVAVGAKGIGWISEDLAKTILQTILPAILASAATVVGTLFPK